MERTKLLTYSVIGLLLLNLFTLGYLFLIPNLLPDINKHKNPISSPNGPAQIIITRLHFNGQQQQQYLEMVKKHQHQTALLTQKTVQLYRTYYSLLTTTHIDSTAAQNISQQIADNQRAIAELNFVHFQQIKALCRPDQQVYFIKLVDELAHLFGNLQDLPSNRNNEPINKKHQNLSPKP